MQVLEHPVGDLAHGVKAHAGKQGIPELIKQAADQPQGAIGQEQGQG